MIWIIWLVLPLLQRKRSSYHLPEDCTKREEYCCVKDERLSNYFHEIFFRLLLLFFCQVWHLKVSESCQTMLNVCICIWLDVLYHDDWSRMGYVGTLCGYLLLETSSWVHCIGTLLYILLAHSLYAGNTHNNVPTEYLLLYHILLYIHYILLYYTRNVPTGYLLQGIAASVLTSPWCQQSLPRPSFYSTWVRRGRCHGL